MEGSESPRAVNRLRSFFKMAAAQKKHREQKARKLEWTRNNAVICGHKAEPSVKLMHKHTAMPRCSFKTNNLLHMKQSICSLVPAYRRGASACWKVQAHDSSVVFKLISFISARALFSWIPKERDACWQKKSTFQNTEELPECMGQRQQRKWTNFGTFSSYIHWPGGNGKSCITILAHAKLPQARR